MATPRILLTPKEAGELLGISEDSVRRLVTAGRLPGCYLPMPKGSALLKIHIRHVEAYAGRVADEAERAMDVSDVRAWRRKGRAI
jgi:excisionase family DNA binding protein